MTTWISPPVIVAGFAIAAVTLAIIMQRKRKHYRKPLEQINVPKFTHKEIKEVSCVFLLFSSVMLIFNQDPERRQLFLDWMDKEGFSIITMSDEVQQQVELYWDLSSVITLFSH